MITDAMLREAAGEAERFLLAHLPEPQPHQFSPKFERRMQKLISRAKHPVRHQVLRYVAAVLLAILTLFGSILAVSPEARASVIGWVKSVYSGQVVEYSTTVKDNTVRHHYRLGCLLAGYKLQDVHEGTDYRIYYYICCYDHGGYTDRYLKFACFYPNEESGSSFSLWVEGYDQCSGFVHGMKADIYISDDRNRSNMIAWCDEETGAIFCIVGYADKETLVKLAESVEIVTPTGWE